MRYICMNQSFNIKFFDDSLCTEKLTVQGMRDLYTYEWDKCYKRAEGEWMVVRRPKWEIQAKDEYKPGPTTSDSATGLTVAAVSVFALASSSLF